MKKKIAIVAGGYSSEHDVSLRSAEGISQWIDRTRYDVDIVDLEKGDNSALDRLRDYDFAYITIHGTPGENGLLQGYLDMIGVPYSCCGVLAAALTFNKYACNHYLQNFGIRIAKSILLRSDGKGGAKLVDGGDASASKIVEEVGLPCFIKSNVGGSSFGCTKVKTEADVIPAVERALKEGDEVICESFMKGTEVTCGVYKTSEKAVAFPVTEVVTSNEFFDYDAKYNGQVDEITPARIPDEVRDRLQANTLRIYDILGCNGIIRVDYILTEGWTLNLLEVNTTPGMTATSFIPQQVRAAGLDISEVLTDIIENKLK
ncbi:MAG: D-alanine--D-alanine ligase [Paludibacteraceae bacterium]|nr:D-alanine--D-alanine ligase [Paludibacteraceae bacterium]